MVRRRKGRRPENAPEESESDAQPRVGPDGRRDDGPVPQSRTYTPPPSPLTRWQLHRPHGGPPRGRRGAEAARPRVFARDLRGEEQRPRRADDAGRSRPRPAAPPYRPRTGTAATPAPATGAIDPFDLFCAYHLGITPEGGYRIQNIHEVARRFGTNAATLRQILTDLGMAADDLVHSGFDLTSAQVDIMVAPEGVSRRELARPLYEEFRTAPKKTRDWAREMDDAQRQIDQTIGRDGRWSPAPRDPAGKQS